MLIIALVLALIGLAALVFAVVTSNALVAWVCIGASALGVLLLIVDALRERHRQQAEALGSSSAGTVERVKSERVKVGGGEVGSATESASELEAAGTGATTDVLAAEDDGADIEAPAEPEPAAEDDAAEREPAAEPEAAESESADAESAAEATETSDDDETPG